MFKLFVIASTGILNSYTFSQKPQEALNLLVTKERYWALFYMPMYTFLHKSLNVLVQIADKMGLQKMHNCTAILNKITLNGIS
jgi:hypothetical protein